MTDSEAYEFVIVAGFTGGDEERQNLSAEMDGYGEEGYHVVDMTTVVMGGAPYTTFILEKEAENFPEKTRMGPTLFPVPVTKDVS